MTPRPRFARGTDATSIFRRGGMILTAITASWVLVTCGGGGGSGKRSDPDMVAVSGTVNPGSAPIASASCRFVDTEGQIEDTTACNQNGTFTLLVPPAVQGYIHCSPPATPALSLTTFASTVGETAGGSITEEHLTPATTIAADIIRNGDASISPEARKLDLLIKIESGSDPDLNIVVAMATRLYRAMLDQQVNAGFGGGSGLDGSDDGGGPSDSDVGGGVGGEAGDGADFSPLPGIECSFLVGSDPTEAEVTYTSALADYLSDGRLDRPDLADLAERVHEGLDYTPEQIQQAFANVFTQGLGQPYTTVADTEGRYFLPIPANLPGFVRCAYPDAPELALATYVPGRRADEVLEDQAVTPAETVFSTLIAPRIDADLAATKENFLADILGLEVYLTGPNLPDGPLTGIRLGAETLPLNGDVGLVAFTATALFNSFYKNGLVVDMAAIIEELSEHLTPEATVDPAYLEQLGLPTDQATVVSEAVTTAGEALDSDLPVALSAARVKVLVTNADAGGDPVADALVEIPDLAAGVTCRGCGDTTDGEGALTLTLMGLPADPAIAVVATISSVAGFETVTLPPVQVAPLATVALDVALSATTTVTLEVEGGGLGGGTVTSTPAGIDCSLLAGTLSGDADEHFAEGSEVVLTATPNPSSAFAGWSDPVCAQADTSCTVVMDGDITVFANFEPACEPATYRFEPSLLSVPSGGGSGSIEVSAPVGCPWSISADEWIRLDPETAVGSGGGLVAYSVPANDGPSRSGTIRAGDQSFTVDQAAADCTYAITPSGATPAAAGGTATITVTPSYTGCTNAWTATTTAGWIDITSGASGSGAGSVTYAVDPNPGASRSATISVADSSFQVDQAAAGCTYTLSPTSNHLPVAGGSGTIAVTPSYAGCTTAWTATTGDSWIHITAGANGNGTGTVTYAVDANSGPSRSATITVAGRNFTLTQEDAYLIDQENWPPFAPPTEIDRVPLNRFIPRQRFTPGLNRLMSVEVYLETVDPDNGDETVYVRIADDSGTLATRSVFLQAGFEGLLRIDFDPPVALAPGQSASLYVLNYETSPLPSRSTFAWRISILDGGGPYGGGTAWHSDMPWWNEDFLFRTYGVDLPMTQP